jgi:antitoxin ParD1/3/4
MRAAVESGEYATTSEIVREALRDWDAYQERRRQSLERLRAEIAKGMEGEGRPMDEVFDELLKKLQKKKAKTA